MAKKCIFILGGARSGKSTYAQQLAQQMGQNVLFVATAEALDDDMRERIDNHKKSRPKSWRTLELPKGIAEKLAEESGGADVVLIDCLTLLVSNLLGDDLDSRRAEEKVMPEIEKLLSVIKKLNATVIIVSNEVGLGLVPDNKLGRIYRDLLGQVNRLIALSADEVYCMVAGLPLKVK